MKVLVYDRQKVLPIKKRSVKAAASAMLAFIGKQFDELSVHFVEEAELTQMHIDFFNDPTPTDCISFPMDEEESTGYKILGEIFISPKAALLYSEKEQSDPYQELTLYLIHGILHLLGQDDISEHDAKEMRRLEAKYLAHLTSETLLIQRQLGS